MRYVVYPVLQLLVFKYNILTEIGSKLNEKYNTGIASLRINRLGTVKYKLIFDKGNQHCSCQYNNNQRGSVTNIDGE